MIVVGTARLLEFGHRHGDAVAPLEAWHQTVQAATWNTPANARDTYRSADPVVRVASGRRVAVFNIKGNRYRLVAGIDYALGIVNVLRVMTHEEYARGKWKDAL